ncbi:MAG: cadherin repeat domain-containing protein, partial [Magnetococcus sp. DMHC-6]
LSVSSIDENTDTSGGFTVGTLTTTDVDAGDTATYTIVGGGDAGSFSILGSNLVMTAGLLDFESKNSYDVMLRVTDSGGLFYEEIFTITVNDRNETPTDMALSVSSLDENTDTSGGVTVGTLTTTDVDAGDSATYTIVGGVDAARFSISGSNLVITAGMLNFESQSAYDVLIRVTDSGGLFYEESFPITVNDLNELPTDILLSTSTIDENTDTSGGTIIGTLSSLDEDVGDTATYTIVGGVDAASFSIVGSDLVLTAGVLDFETKNSYGVTVRVTDSGPNTFDKALTITINDLNEAPTITSGGSATFVENATGTPYVATASDVDAGDSVTLSLAGNDAALFAIDASGNVTFLTPPNFEVPTDQNGDHVYDIDIVATDQNSLTDTVSVAITVTDINEVPTISSGGVANFAENGTGIVYAAIGNDEDAGDFITWSLSGVDATLFDIDVSGNVTFITSPDFELPTDAGGNNVYDIQVIATDVHGLFVSQAVAITVTNVNEITGIVLDNNTAALNRTTTKVGSFTTSGEAGATYTYTLLDNAGGRFTIVNDELHVVDTPVMVHGIYTISVQSTDSNLVSITQPFTITVYGFDPDLLDSGVAALRDCAKTTYANTWRNLQSATPNSQVVLNASELSCLIIGKVDQQISNMGGGDAIQDVTDVVSRFELNITPNRITSTMEISFIDEIFNRLPAAVLGNTGVVGTVIDLFGDLTQYANANYKAGVQFSIVPVLNAGTISFDQSSSYVSVTVKDADLIPNLTFNLKDMVDYYNGIKDAFSTNQTLEFFVGGGATPPLHFLKEAFGDLSQAKSQYDTNLVLARGSAITGDSLSVPMSQLVDYYWPGLVKDVVINSGSIGLVRQ